MADLTLKDGREINFDFEKITEEEYESMFSPKTGILDEKTWISTVGGLTVEEINKLSRKEYKKLAMAFYKAGGASDPN